MIIDTKGNILSMWNRADGAVVFDSNYDLKIDFHVCIPYTEQQKSAYKEIAALKKQLASTDYKAIKFAEGFLSDDEYADIKAEREKWRERINSLKFDEPTISREQMDEAEKIAVSKLKESEVKHGAD